jgi:hypothetical protein
MSEKVEHKTAGRRKSADESDDPEMDDISQIESVTITIPTESSAHSSTNDTVVHDLEYRATDCPKWNTAILLGFQASFYSFLDPVNKGRFDCKVGQKWNFKLQLPTFNVTH